jgi:hypothetical protein
MKFAPPPPNTHAPCERPPDPPRGLRVEAHTRFFVELAWEPPGVRPDRYVLDVADTPGSAEATPRELGRWPLFVASNVPRGIYYVRVRAKNTCGTSAATPEIRVVVP